MSQSLVGRLGLLWVFLLAASLVHAGGVDPRDMPLRQAEPRQPVTATPAQTEFAVGEARRAVAPPVEAAVPAVRTVPTTVPRVATAPAAGADSWLFSSGEGRCVPLDHVNRQVKNISSFKTPQEFARQMQQRGYQAFVLDMGATRDQQVRVRVPDLDLDLLFLRPAACR